MSAVCAGALYLFTLFRHSIRCAVQLNAFIQCTKKLKLDKRHGDALFIKSHFTLVSNNANINARVEQPAPTRAEVAPFGPKGNKKESVRYTSKYT